MLSQMESNCNIAPECGATSPTLPGEIHVDRLGNPPGTSAAGSVAARPARPVERPRSSRPARPVVPASPAPIARPPGPGRSPSSPSQQLGGEQAPVAHRMLQCPHEPFGVSGTGGRLDRLTAAGAGAVTAGVLRVAAPAEVGEPAHLRGQRSDGCSGERHGSRARCAGAEGLGGCDEARAEPVVPQVSAVGPAEAWAAGLREPGAGPPTREGLGVRPIMPGERVRRPTAARTPPARRRGP
jgi:hypothetical protein